MKWGYSARTQRGIQNVHFNSKTHIHLVVNIDYPVFAFFLLLNLPLAVIFPSAGIALQPVNK